MTQTNSLSEAFPVDTALDVQTLESVSPRPSITNEDIEEELLPDKDEKPDPVEPLKYFELFSDASHLEKLLIIVGVICALAAGALLPVYSIFFGDFTNAFGHPTIHLMDIVNELSLKFLYLGIGAGISAYASTYISTWTAARQASRLNYKFLSATLSQEISFFDTNKEGTGGLLQCINQDVIDVQEAIGDKAQQLIRSFATFVSGFIIAFIRGWDMTLVMLGSIPIMLVVMSMVAKHMASSTQRQNSSYAKASIIAQQAIAQVRTVFSYVREKQMIRDYIIALRASTTEGESQGMAIGFMIGLFIMIIYASVGIALVYGSYRVAAGHYSGGQVMNVLMSIMQGGMALGQGGPNIQHIIKGKVSGARIFRVINRTPNISIDGDGIDSDEKLAAATAETDVNSPTTITTTTNGSTPSGWSIDFVNIKFAYPARPESLIFQDFTLRINAGETMALVGESGSGKSTAVSLVERFYDPLSGHVLFNGVDLTAFRLSWARQKIGLVSQEPTLFATSLYDNILMGNPSASREEVEAAAHAANAVVFIERLPEKYETKVGERGLQLSGGQKQRIAIARAILKNPKILLLDEATSALDTQSERVVQAALDRVAQGRTCLVIAHRLSTVRNADCISVMSKGVVVEQGKHDALIGKKGGLYATLAMVQGQGDKQQQEARQKENARRQQRRWKEEKLEGEEGKDETTTTKTGSRDVQDGAYKEKYSSFTSDDDSDGYTDDDDDGDDDCKEEDEEEADRKLDQNHKNKSKSDYDNNHHHLSPIDAKVDANDEVKKKDIRKGCEEEGNDDGGADCGEETKSTVQSLANGTKENGGHENSKDSLGLGSENCITMSNPNSNDNPSNGHRNLQSKAGDANSTSPSKPLPSTAPATLEPLSSTTPSKPVKGGDKKLKKIRNNRSQGEKEEKNGDSRDGFDQHVLSEIEGGGSKEEKAKKDKGEEEDVYKVSFKRLAKLSRPELLFIIVGSIGSLAAGAASPAFSFVFSSMITNFYQPDLTRLKHRAVFFCGMFLVLAGCTFVFYGLRIAAFAIVGHRLAARVRAKLFRAMMRQDVGWFDQESNNSGQLVSLLSTDATYIKGAVIDVLGLSLQSFSTLTFGFILAFAYDWRMALVVGGLLPFMFVTQWLNAKYNTRQSNRADMSNADANQAASESLTSVRVVQGYNMQASLLHRYSQHMNDGLEKVKQSANVAAASSGMTSFLTFATYSLVIYFGGHELKNGWTSFDHMLKAFMALLYGASSMAQATNGFADIGKAHGAIQHIFPILDRKPPINTNDPEDDLENDEALWHDLIEDEEHKAKGVDGGVRRRKGGKQEDRGDGSLDDKDGDNGDMNEDMNKSAKASYKFCKWYGHKQKGPSNGVVPSPSSASQPNTATTTTSTKHALKKTREPGVVLPTLEGRVVFKNVKFEYPSRPGIFIFERFSLDIPAGKTMALVGESGSGKSTAVGLIERFYDPIGGHVYIDGVDVKLMHLRWLRSHIALVSQEPLLFTGTILDNIKVGNPQASLEEVVAAAAAANAKGFIERTKELYNTLVGEGGVQLSGGQKQRIAIARAILKNPKILLLDEATSALDTASERVVQKALDQVILNRTCVVIAHRLSTVRNADCIAVLSRGVLLEKGSHDELVAQENSAYNRLMIAQVSHGV
uniref:ATP-binding cassette transporter n=1 Tax=Polytomella parva TaxID=51329 RepID=A0A7S0USK3_9CHLO|mmetsp:Transcript_133/g.144  ORF Transcript_133/g.144 Transcript_133/m.144 type:complete len:1646 (+) Transcript_133:82-5019(+)